jgi:hypothetical protein
MTRIALLAALAACSAARAGTETRAVATAPRPAPVVVPSPAAPEAPPILVIDEICAAGVPDWFEVVNTTTLPIELSDFVYVDVADDLARARPLPARTLRPGERHVQFVDVAIDGFRLGGGEELWIYRAADGEEIDGVDWADGDSPDDGSYARVPSVTGDFTTTVRDTRGEPSG